MDRTRTCLLAVAAGLAVEQNREKRKTRRKWTKDWLLKRSALSNTNLLEELRLESGDWHNYLRTDEDTYRKLLKLVTPLIERRDTHLHTGKLQRHQVTCTIVVNFMYPQHSGNSSDILSQLPYCLIINNHHMSNQLFIFTHCKMNDIIKTLQTWAQPTGQRVAVAHPREPGKPLL
ncbi:unnamed protein product [Callosobruchus maculatus]|uniref:Uncharacterized protein n=1 Tax=Callosobruchus maculatus TaxID=64391 RepID=A0A653DE89_CALMS|nr:unnamed protein product [Callosobruchus maculatus]